MYEELDQILLSIHRRRVQVGVAALAVSCVVHIVLAMFFPELVRMRDVGNVKETEPPFVVNEIRAFIPEERSTGERPKPASAVNLPIEAGKAPGRVDKSLLEPRMSPAAAGEAGVKGLTKGVEGTLAQPSWQPQPDVLMITKTVVNESQPRILPRRYVETSPRVPDEGDYTVDRAEAVKAAAAAGSMGGDSGFGKIDLGRPSVGDGVGSPGIPGLIIEPAGDTPRTGGGGEGIRKRLEKLLVAEAKKYVPSRGQYAYCMINIRRVGEEILPVLPKDILLVQDCSASMTEQRIHFCREGWSNSLALIGSRDRFNVIRFRDRIERCFPDWTAPEPEAFAAARDFIGNMASAGETDVYGSLRALLEEKRMPGRPLIAMVVSDGMPTVGETDSSKIIEEFSDANRGALSVFAMGTTREANAYLLDLLGYRNRGDAFVVRGGRWEIPVAIEGRMRGISRPVLTNLRVAFAAACQCESFPELTGNLYLDRSLVIFCRFPRNLEQLVFQITGRAGETDCDMVFKLDLATVAGEGEILRTRWALQKTYHLMGEYTRTRDSRLLRERQAIAREYGVNIPYQGVLQK